MDLALSRQPQLFLLFHLFDNFLKTPHVELAFIASNSEFAEFLFPEMFVGKNQCQLV